MARTYGETIYIDRDPNDPHKGWGWVEVTIEDIKTFKIPTAYPDTYKNKVFGSPRNLPSKGRAGTKKFTLHLNGEIIIIRAQKFLTIQSICAWAKTWAGQSAKLVTPGNRTYSLDGDKLTHQSHFVYFILNEDSNAIKIGRAKDVDKRLNALQTSSPSKLKLLKSVQIEGKQAANELEKSLHRKFSENRLVGEWFKAETILLEYISQL